MSWNLLARSLHSRCDQLRLLRYFLVVSLLLCAACNRPNDAPATGAALSPETEKSLLDARDLAVQYRFAEAEAAYKAAIRKIEASEGRNSAAYAVALDQLGRVYLYQGRLREAQDALEKSIRVFAQYAPDDQLEYADALNNLGAVFFMQARYARAEASFEQAIAMWERSLKASDPRVLTALINLAAIERNLGQTAGAERLYRLAMAREKAAAVSKDPSESSEQAAIQIKTLNELGLLLSNDEGNCAESEPLLREALRIGQARFGENDPRVAETRMNLGLLLDDTNRPEAAEAELRTVFAIDQSRFGKDDPATAQAEYQLGRLFLHNSRCVDAVTWLDDAVAARRKTLGSDHRDVGIALSRRAAALACEGPDHYEKARTDYESARQIFLISSRQNGGLDDRSVSGIREHTDRVIEGYVPLLAEIARLRPADSAQAASSAFAVADQLRSGPADAALGRAGVRRMTSQPQTLAAFAHVQQLRRQTGHARQQFLSAAREQNSNHANADRMNALAAQLQSLEAQLDQETGALFTRFPKYGELLAPSPITPSELQSLMKPDETLVAYYSLADRLEVWVVPQKGPVKWFELSVKRTDLAEMVKRLRASLSIQAPYDVEDAYGLYKAIVGPIRPFVKSRRLIIVTDQTTLPIPFAALIVDDRGKSFSILRQRYREGMSPSAAELSTLYPRLHWFFNQGFTLSFLPSATSMRFLRSRNSPRQFSKGSSEPFIGFGDPALSGSGNERGGVMLALTGASVAAQVRALPALPGTRGELLAEARLLGADPQRSVYLGEQATRVNLMNLNDDRLEHALVVSFATHALIGGEVNGLREPALVLTPPRHPSEQDVGLLTLDDILGLRLSNSDWVILSACNTAGANADGFSGLARAFFYAGGRSLLVSQWNVDDAATLELMTAVMSAYVSNGRSFRADALRAGISRLINGGIPTGPGYLTHPAAWAPFFVVGES